MDFYAAAATFLNETTTSFCCSPDLRFVLLAHPSSGCPLTTDIPQHGGEYLWPGCFLPRAVQCHWGPILSYRCGDKGDKGEVKYDQTLTYSGQVYAVGCLVTAGTTGRLRMKKRIRTQRKLGQGGSFHQPLYLLG